MTSKTIVAIAVAVIGLIATIARTWRWPRLRDDLQTDLQIYAALPACSKSRSALLASIDRRVLELSDVDRSLRRDPAGITIAVIMICGFGWLTFWTAAKGGVWIVAAAVAAVLAAVGAVGLVGAWPKARRDEKGNRLPESTTESAEIRSDALGE